MTIHEAFNKLSEVQALALMGYAEARSEGYDGIVAVMSVAKTRQRRSRHSSIKAVVFRPKQFSCFNSNDEQYERLVAIAKEWDSHCKSLPWLRACLWLAGGVISGDMPSPVGSATNYHRDNVSPVWTADPKKMKFICRIKHHLFYEEMTAKGESFLTEG